jgi:hypothetical protein
VRLLRISLALSSVFLLALAGCKEEDDIRREEVKHPDREKIRLRVAVLEKGDLVWFFRMSGPVALVTANEKTFEDFVHSVRFEADKDPTWTDPKGWQKDHKSRDRFAGYRLKADKTTLEIAVTRFPADKFKMMDNMHRWQNQVNVPLTETHDELERQIKREVVEGQLIKWVDLQGLGIHTVTKPPEAIAMNKKQFLPQLPVAQAGGGGGGGRIPFKYPMPQGWIKKPPRQIALEVLEVTDGKQSAEITFVPLPGDGGGVPANINRWRKEVQLPGLSDADAEKSAAVLQVAGVKSYIVDIANDNGPPLKNRTLGVIIPLGRQTWFVKMSGPRDWLGQNKAAFEAFAKSLTLEK